MLVFAKSDTMIYNISTFIYVIADIDHMEEYFDLDICLNWNVA